MSDNIDIVRNGYNDFLTGNVPGGLDVQGWQGGGDAGAVGPAQLRKGFAS